MKAYSQDLRDRVISTYESGECNKAKLSRIFSVGYDKQAILDYLISHPDANGVQIRDDLIPEIPMSTFYDTLKRLKITYKKKNPNTNKSQKLKEKIS